ncbi:hypothetical protein EMCG_04146 [[Emmonsia] crescens]|uniref:Uncharacterized protein n=1 Tax=[Emmonsia] crescens TaxID=73230 RepID=A0A0G2HT56_9EURO|nr:hypothetical protein EMCG_04146 [Emmonsia crescens UAMH 3008]
MAGARGKQRGSSEKLLGYTQQATLRIVISKQLNKGNPSFLMSLFNGFGTLQHRPHVGLLLSIHILVSLRICPHPPGVKFHRFEDPNTESNSETICTKLSARNYAQMLRAMAALDMSWEHTDLPEKRRLMRRSVWLELFAAYAPLLPYSQTRVHTSEREDLLGLFLKIWNSMLTAT